MIALSDLNIIGSKTIYNSKPEDLYEITLSKKMGVLTKDLVLSVNTGKFTGRSPKDRYIVKDEITKDKVWWGDCLLYTSPSPRDRQKSRMPSSA